MPNLFRFVKCLLLAVVSISITACGSSGGDTAEPSEDRPTIVSSDAVTIRENSEPPATEGGITEPASDPAGSIVAESGAGTDISPSSEEIDNNGADPDGIDTIEELLAHLEAKRLEELKAVATDAPATDSSASEETDLNTESEPPSDGAASVPTEPGEATGSSPETASPETASPDTASDDDGTNVNPSEVADDTSEVPAEVEQTEQNTGAEDTTEPADANTVAEGGVEDDPTQSADSVSNEGVAADMILDDGSSTPVDPEPSAVDASFSTSKHDLVVDCGLSLPCATSNDDGAVNVAVENVYRHPETRRLAIAMSVTANRDTAIKWDSDVTSTDDVATTYNGISREFSGFYQFDRDNDMVTLLAGTTLLVVQHFREMPSDTTVSLVRFDTGYIEAGVRTTLQFSNLPLDPVLGDIVDCADVVPCSWVSNDKSFSVNVLKVSGLWQTGRLRIDLEVRATVGMGINVFSAEPVVGNDGSVFTPRTHSLGGTSDYRDFTVPLVPEGVLSGSQDFLKNANRLATSLKQVKLGMTRVDAPGAGSPVFRNLPLE